MPAVKRCFASSTTSRADLHGEIVAGLKELKKNLQSLFVQGRVTNADPDSVGLWVDRVRDIRPLGVQI